MTGSARIRIAFLLAATVVTPDLAAKSQSIQSPRATVSADTVLLSDFPPEDLPDLEDLDRYEPGDAHRYYHGIGRRRDLGEARHAAFADFRRGGFGRIVGASVLMLIYGDSDDVEHLDLSVKLARQALGANRPATAH